MKTPKSNSTEAHFQRCLDALIQKEALGTISVSESLALEQLLWMRDNTRLSPKTISRMDEEQRALDDLLTALERYLQIVGRKRRTKSSKAPTNAK